MAMFASTAKTLRTTVRRGRRHSTLNTYGRNKENHETKREDHDDLFDGCFCGCYIRRLDPDGRNARGRSVLTARRHAYSGSETVQPGSSDRKVERTNKRPGERTCSDCVQEHSNDEEHTGGPTAGGHGNGICQIPGG